MPDIGSIFAGLAIISIVAALGIYKILAYGGLIASTLPFIFRHPLVQGPVRFMIAGVFLLVSAYCFGWVNNEESSTARALRERVELLIRDNTAKQRIIQGSIARTRARQEQEDALQRQVETLEDQILEAENEIPESVTAQCRLSPAIRGGVRSILDGFVVDTTPAPE